MSKPDEPSREVLLRAMGLTKAIQTANSLDEAHDEILATTVALTRADLVVFFELSPKGSFDVKRRSGPAAGSADLIAACVEDAEAALARHRERAKRAADTGEPVRNVGTADGGPPLSSAARLVRSGDKVFGALAVARRGVETFSEAEQALLRSVADSASAGLASRVVEPPRPALLNAVLRDPKLEAEVKRVETRAFRRSDLEVVEGLARDRLLGAGPAHEATLARIERVAPSDLAVLIRGETGTGKEVTARLIHAASRRRNGPFVVTNPSAMAPALFEAELFGSKRGSYTGSTRDILGLIRSAEGGTLFIDEVGDLAADLQVKLLRVLQERKVLPLGENQEIPVDFRIIAATNAPLEELVRAGSFRMDFFYRLSKAVVDLKPLREQLEHLPVFVEHFLKKLGPGGVTKTLAPSAWQALRDHDWPGNIRELSSVIETALVLARGSERIEARHIEIHRVAGPAAKPRGPLTLAEAERALAENGGSRTRAAQALGVDRRTLQRLLARES